MLPSTAQALDTLYGFREVLRDGPPGVSFEFFPPKTDAMEAALWETITALEPLRPQFVSVTYGAGGSTRDRTHATVKRILDETTLTPAAHLTCVAASRDEVNAVARDYWEAGVRHIVALRGDPPAGGAFQAHPDGYQYSAQLVEGLKRIGDFEISVAAFPETHPEAVSPEADIDYLKRKLDAGATRAITQYFFDADVFFRFHERARAAGITAPIVPGLMPIANFTQAVNFSARCGATVPAWVHRLFDGLDDDPALRQSVAAAVMADLCRELMRGGVREFHFYTLNRAALTRAMCRLVGVW